MWLSHHGCALFSLPNRAKTTITHPSNLLYGDVVDSESGGVEGGGVPGGGHDVDSDDEDDEAEDAPRVHSDRR